MDCHAQKRVAGREEPVLQAHWESAAWAERGAGMVSKERNQLSSKETFLNCLTCFPASIICLLVPSKSQPSLTALEEAGQGGFNEWKWTNVVVTMQLLKWLHPLPSRGWWWAGCPWMMGKQLRWSPIRREKLTTQSLMNSLSLHNNTLCSTSN